MRIFGKFTDINGKMVTVDILTNGDRVDYSKEEVEDVEKKYVETAQKLGESVYEAKAKARADTLFPKYAKAASFTDAGFTEPSQEPDDGGHSFTDAGFTEPGQEPDDGGHSFTDAGFTVPGDNIKGDENPPLIPDVGETDAEVGNLYSGEEADYTIGENGLWFGGVPFEVTSEIDDNFEVIIKQTGLLRLVTSQYMGHLLFSSKMRKSRIIVRRENTTVFDGYLTMNIYNQPFNTDADIFEVQCVDKLATINFFNYKKTFPETYKNNKNNSTVVSFKTVLFDALSGLDGNVWYDCSKSIDGNNWEGVFDDIGIGENVFFGDDFDGMMNREDSLTQILQYLNLHIVQHKEDFYIFDWNSVKKGNTTWKCLTDDEKEDTYGGKATILSGDMHMARDTEINILDVYSQVQVTCEVDEAEEILADMLDEKDLKSWYNNVQKYMTEYISEGEGETARNCMFDMLDGKSNDYDSGSMVDWYVQALYNPNWQMNVGYQIPLSKEPTVTEGGRYVNQHEWISRVKKNGLSCGFFRIGKLERKATELADVDPVPKLDTKEYLYISVNGNELREQEYARPSDAEVAAVEPIMVYTGNTATGAFSPVDYDTTNYLVFEGKIELQPTQKESETQMIQTIATNYVLPTTVASENNEDGRFYVRKWYSYFDCQQENADDEGWTHMNSLGYKRNGGKIFGTGLMMPAKDKSIDISKIDKHEAPFEYSYSAEGDATDQIRKIPVLECYMKIGNKLLVEWNIKKDGSSDFGWFDENNLPDKVINGQKTGTKASTFTLGFNPAIGDVILGKEYDIQNTVSFTMNIDAKGTAIPIKKEDALSGDIEFKILGPCTTVWDQVIRIHPSFWRHTSWEQDALPILAYTENIIISDFSIKVVSDNALDNNDGDDNDLMYVAQETDYNFNTKHETSFSIITQLDSATAKAKGIKNGVYMNAAVDMTTNEPLGYLYSKKEGKKKAEEHYVYDYLEDWRRSRITMSMTLKDDGIDFRDRFGSMPLKKSFNIIGISKNIKMGTVRLDLREYADGLADFEEEEVEEFKEDASINS